MSLPRIFKSLGSCTEEQIMVLAAPKAFTNLPCLGPAAPTRARADAKMRLAQLHRLQDFSLQVSLKRGSASPNCDKQAKRRHKPGGHCTRLARTKHRNLNPEVSRYCEGG